MLPVQDVWVHEDEAITLHCDVPFAVPPELQVTWMFAKDVSSMHVQCAQTSGGAWARGHCRLCAWQQCCQLRGTLLVHDMDVRAASSKCESAQGRNK